MTVEKPTPFGGATGEFAEALTDIAAVQREIAELRDLARASIANARLIQHDQREHGRQMADYQRRLVALEQALLGAPKPQQPTATDNISERDTRPERPVGVAPPSAKSPPPPGTDGGPLWLALAKGELGQAEIVGGQSNPRIQEYLSAVGFQQADDSEVPWCSAFCAWVMRQARVPTVGVTGMARSWLRWGRELDGPRIGAIVVLWRGTPTSPSGHVGLLAGVSEDRILLLGGNQAGAPGGAVSLSGYPRARVLGFRWPT